MTTRDEGQYDIPHMQVQVLRSTFFLLVLAVTLLVIFSSMAMLRNPRKGPMVGVVVDVAPQAGGQSDRMRRGAEIGNSYGHMRAPSRREKSFKDGSSKKHGRKHKKKIENDNDHKNKTKSANHTESGHIRHRHFNTTIVLTTVEPAHIDEGTRRNRTDSTITKQRTRAHRKENNLHHSKTKQGMGKHNATRLTHS